MGFGPNTVVLYGADGQLIRQLALLDFLSGEEIKELPRSVSSIWWGQGHYLADEEEYVVLRVVEPGQESSKQNPRMREIRVRLANGKVIQKGSASLDLAGEPRISREKAQDIATQYATDMKFEIESKGISIEWYDTPWNRWIRLDSTSEYDVSRLKKLSAHQYYAVEFTPHDRMTKGGQTVIFVDSHTGEVITFAAYK
jgi:hypothetical protein